jgi:hypothetical protein
MIGWPPGASKLARCPYRRSKFHTVTPSDGTDIIHSQDDNWLEIYERYETGG